MPGRKYDRTMLTQGESSDSVLSDTSFLKVPVNRQSEPTQALPTDLRLNKTEE